MAKRMSSDYKIDREMLAKICENALARLPASEQTTKRKTIIANTIEAMALARREPERLEEAARRLVGSKIADRATEEEQHLSDV